MSRDSETVSKNMRSIHSKDTSIELQLRKAQLYISGVKISKNIPTNVFKLLKKLYGTAPFQILLSIPLTNSIKFMAASFLIQP